MGLVKTPADLIALTGEEGMQRLRGLSGWGGVSATNLLSEIDRVKGGVPLGRFVNALGIRGVGKSTAMSLAEEYGGWEV